MRFLSYHESEKWFAEIGARLEGWTPSLRTRSTDIKIARPEKSLPLIYLANRLISWFAGDKEVMVWLSHWEVYISEPLDLFERARRSCGETRPVIDAPGHICNKCIKQEHAFAAELAFLIMAFNWQAYIVGKDSEAYIYLGDEFVYFSDKSEERQWAAAEILK